MQIINPVQIDIIKAEGYWIGRPDSEIDWYPDIPVLMDNIKISRKHAMLWKIDDALYLTDTSLNGTYVNGQRLAPGNKDAPQRGPFFPVEWDAVVTLGLDTSVSLAQFRPKGDQQLFQSTRIIQTSAEIDPNQTTITIGRSADCDIVTDHPRISRQQALIVKEGSQYFISHTGQNPTRVNGEIVEKRIAISGQVKIEIGPYQVNLNLSTLQAETQTVAGLMSLHVMGASRKAGNLVFLDDVSLTVRPNEIVGIMGPSGSGKTTLMNVMNGYNQPQKGTVTLGVMEKNGQETSYNMFDDNNPFRQEIGYVPQEDIIHRELTVGESLEYTAGLRMGQRKNSINIQSNVSSKDGIHFQVTKVLVELGLEKRDILAKDVHGNPTEFGPIETRKEDKGKQVPDTLRETIIGTPEKRGISGGQRKRVNIGQELLSDPDILFLDEPTSGLSSVDTENLMELLRRKASLGSTIILTIHQPSEKAFLRMNNIAILGKGGKLAYYGPTAQAADYFEHTTGLQRSENDNPADYILRALETEPKEAILDEALKQAKEEKGELTKEDKFKIIYQQLPTAENPKPHPAHPEGSFYKSFVLDRLPSSPTEMPRPKKGTKPPSVNSLVQWWTLTKRYAAIKRKDVINTLMLMVQAPIIGLFLLLAFGGNHDNMLHNGALYDIGGVTKTFNNYLREYCGVDSTESFARDKQTKEHRLLDKNCHRLNDMSLRDYSQKEEDAAIKGNSLVRGTIQKKDGTAMGMLDIQHSHQDDSRNIDKIEDLFDPFLRISFDAYSQRTEDNNVLYIKSVKFKEARAYYEAEETSKSSSDKIVYYRVTDEVLQKLNLQKVRPEILHILNGPNPAGGETLKYAVKNEKGIVKLLLYYFFPEEAGDIFKKYKASPAENRMQEIPDSHRNLIETIIETSRESVETIIARDRQNEQLKNSCQEDSSGPSCVLTVTDGQESYDFASNLDAQRWLIALFLLAASGFWFGTTNSIREIVVEQAIYQRERKVNLKILPYLCSKLGVLSVLSLAQCSVLLLIVWPILGLSGSFLLYLSFLFLSSLTGILIGFFVSSLVTTTEAAMSILPIILIPQIMLAGALKHIGAMHWTLESISRLMPVRWILEGMVSVESQVTQYVNNFAGIELINNFSEIIFRKGGNYNPTDAFFGFIKNIDFMKLEQQMYYVMLKNVGIIFGFCILFFLFTSIYLKRKDKHT